MTDARAGTPSTAVPSRLAAWDATTPLRRSLALLLLALVVYVPTALHGLRWVNTDSIGASAAAWRLAEAGTFDMTGYEHVAWVRDTPRGPRVNRLPGPVLWAVPFYLVASPFTADGEDPPLVPGALSAAVAGALIVVALGRLGERLGGPRLGLGVALVGGFGTSVWSISATGLWTHTVTQMGLLLALLAAAAGRTSGIGLGSALAVIARPHLAVYPLVEGVGRAWRRRSIQPMLVVGALSALGVVGLLLYDWLAFGDWLPPTYQDQVSRAAPGGQPAGASTGVLPNLLWSFVDPRRGLLVFSPWVLVLLPGLREAWRRAEPWVRRAAVGGLAYTVAQASVNNYDGGQGFFGYRLMLEPLTLWAPLLALAYQHHTRERPMHRLAFRATIAVAVATQVAGAVVFPFVAGG